METFTAWTIPNSRMVSYNTSFDDPRHERYLKVCFVCQEEAKAGQEHLRNYGGVVCYSCRAFWRRSHQKTRNPNFVCKKGGNCTITVKTRRRCQKCRYNRCIQTGMSPDAVLDDDQKKIRFRKLLLKRQRLQGLQTTDNIQDDDDEDDSGQEEQEENGTHVAEAENTEDIQNDNAADMPEPESKEYDVASLPERNPEPSAASESDFDVDDLSEVVQVLVQCFEAAKSRTQSGRADDVIAQLKKLHLDDSGISLVKEDVLHLFDNVAEVFKTFARLQR